MDSFLSLSVLPMNYSQTAFTAPLFYIYTAIGQPALGSLENVDLWSEVEPISLLKQLLKAL